MERVTKDVLKKLNAARGKLDTDSGKVFDQFVGRLNMADRLYYGKLIFSAVGEEAPKETFSMSSILGGAGNEPLPDSYTITESEASDGNPPTQV